MWHLKLQDIMELKINLSLFFVSMVMKFWDKSDPTKRDSNKNLTIWSNWDSRPTVIFSAPMRNGSPMEHASKDTTCKSSNLFMPEMLVICDSE